MAPPIWQSFRSAFSCSTQAQLRKDFTKKILKSIFTGTLVANLFGMTARLCRLFAQDVLADANGF
jgi:hypothetical protein